MTPTSDQPVDRRGPQRLVPLTLGWQCLDRSVALDGHAPGTTDVIPIPGWVIEHPDGLVLYDTGFDPTADAVELAFPGFPPPDVIALPQALAAAGYDLDDVGDVVLSHLMVDHAGGLRTLRPRTRVWVQAAEWDFALGAGAASPAYRPRDLEGIDVEVRLVDGEAEPWPGVRLVPTPGHCPGHQSLAVHLPDGWIVLAADAADLQANLTARIAPGILLQGRDEALASLDRLRHLGAELGALVLPGHDPDVWATLPPALGQLTLR
ncbi:MAG: N-acyl homoserine lactone hydrolase [Acidimicrobiaceae bacterium]